MITRTKIEVNSESYLAVKDLVLKGDQFIRFDVELNDFKIKTLKVVEIDGRDVAINRTAISELINILGISKSFYDLLNNSFDNDQEILNLILSAARGSKNLKLTMLFNSQFNEITKVYVAGSKAISDAQYFDMLEKVLAKAPNSYLRNISIAPNGHISSTIANPDLAFQFGNINDECFTGGMTLDLDASQVSSSFFTERLVCSNGAQIKDKLCTHKVKTNSEVPSFIDALLSSEFNIKSIEEFKKRVNRIYNTTASLHEVLDVERRLKNTLGANDEAELLMSNMSIESIKRAFPEHYMTDHSIHRYLRTNLSVWDLVNEVTAISSRIEQGRMRISPLTNRKLQVIGGHLMFANPQLPPNNIRQIF